MERFRMLAAGLLAAASAMSAPAWGAGPVDGFYLSGAAQLQWVRAVDFELIGALNTVHPADFKQGWGGSISVGRGFAGPRVEFELAKRSSDVDSFGSAGSVGPGSGDLGIGTAMINVLYDFATGSRFVPYLGAGIGLARVEANGIARDIGAGCCTGFVSGDDDVVGWQVVAGVAVDLTARLAMMLDYRYLGTADARLTYGTGCTGAGASCLTNGELEQSFSAQAVSLGLRWTF